jgi:predicted oxidoreductase
MDGDVRSVGLLCNNEDAGRAEARVSKAIIKKTSRRFMMAISKCMLLSIERTAKGATRYKRASSHIVVSTTAVAFAREGIKQRS